MASKPKVQKIPPPRVRVGIDIGVGGAIAVLLEGDGTLLDDSGKRSLVLDMPTVARNSGSGRMVDAAGLANLIGEIRSGYDVWMVFVERATPRPRDGSIQGFGFGVSFGIVLGVLASLSMPYTVVSPAVWKRRAGLLKTSKEASRRRALELYPDAADRLTRKKDEGRAEAILIARYALDPYPTDR